VERKIGELSKWFGEKVGDWWKLERKIGELSDIFR
jgi:hypothetical protein